MTWCLASGPVVGPTHGPVRGSLLSSGPHDPGLVSPKPLKAKIRESVAIANATTTTDD